MLALVSLSLLSLLFSSFSSAFGVLAFDSRLRLIQTSGAGWFELGEIFFPSQITLTKSLMKKIIERCDDMVFVSFLPEIAFKILTIWCISAMQPSGISKLVRYIKWDEGEGNTRISHDLAILTRGRPTNEECYVPSRLSLDGISPHSKGAGQTVDRARGS